MSAQFLRSAACTALGLPSTSARRATLSSHVCFAKKGGKAQKKQGSLLGDNVQLVSTQPWRTTDLIMQHFLMIESYWRKLRRPLMEGAGIEDIAMVMWEAPFAILTHNRGSQPEGTEAVFTFANKGVVERAWAKLLRLNSLVPLAINNHLEAAALEVFEAEWDQLVGQPSSVCSTDPTTLEEREALLAATMNSDAGFQTSLNVVRRSLKGTLFEMCNATLWNIETPTGKTVGQAVRFDTVRYGDGPEVRLGAVGLSVPTPEGVAAQEAAVQEQAALVRSLKEEQGLSNSDPAVAAAVALLLEKKEALVSMQAALAKAAAQSEGDTQDKSTDTLAGEIPAAEPGAV